MESHKQGNGEVEPAKTRPNDLLSVCGSKQVEALQWEPHDKVIADDRHIVTEAPLYQTMSFKLNVYFHGPKKIGGVHGTASPCLYLQPASTCPEKDDADDDDTIKWYRDTNAQISVGVPMAPPLLNDDGSFPFFVF
ncbi:hypothetical protein Tco_0955218 [Tanacetum coccineum]|uniref:Uncharacterized protein n=1 Tax=Tanacetum coccineum TaxID=301880 RepID=A0ABQ5E6L0_9ASTR